MRKACIVGIFVCNGAVVYLFVTAVTNIWCLSETGAAFLLKIGTGLVTGWTGSTLDAAKNNLSAGICLLTVITVDTEVFGVVKGPFVIPVREPVSHYLF